MAEYEPWEYEAIKRPATNAEIMQNVSNLARFGTPTVPLDERIKLSFMQRLLGFGMILKAGINSGRIYITNSGRIVINRCNEVNKNDYTN